MKKTQETTLELIQRDYFEVAEVDSIEKLKKTSYWKYYEQDLERLSKTKIVVSTKEKVSNFLQCEVCKKDLVRFFYNNLIFINDIKSADISLSEILITCSCGTKNTFKREEQWEEKLGVYH